MDLQLPPRVVLSSTNHTKTKPFQTSHLTLWAEWNGSLRFVSFRSVLLRKKRAFQILVNQAHELYQLLALICLRLFLVDVSSVSLLLLPLLSECCFLLNLFVFFKKEGLKLFLVLLWAGFSSMIDYSLQNSIDFLQKFRFLNWMNDVKTTRTARREFKIQD